MMKSKVKNYLSISMLITFFTFLQGAYVTGDRTMFYFISQILFTTLLLFVGQYLTSKINSAYRFVEIGAEFLMVMGIVLSCGYIFRWYTLKYISNVIWIIVVVYVLAYILDIANTKKDVAFINQQIQSRKMKKIK